MSKGHVLCKQHVCDNETGIEIISEVSRDEVGSKSAQTRVIGIVDNRQ